MSNKETRGAKGVIWIWLVVTIIAILMVAKCANDGPGARAAAAPPAASWLDTVQPCEFEDGSGDRQTYPCVWDATTRGNGLYGPGREFVIYVRGTDAPCPTAAMVARLHGVCFDVDAFERTTPEPGDVVNY